MISLMMVTLAFTSFCGFAAQEFTFDDVLKYNQTCGLHPLTKWAADGTVVLTSGDLVSFRPRVTINLVKEVCSVDLTRCPPTRLPTSPQACYCASRTGDRYRIHIGADSTPAQSGMSVQAQLPGFGPLKNIMGAATIGTLPQISENNTPVSATYTLDGNTPRDLLETQNITVCPTTLLHLKICVAQQNTDADLIVKTGIYSSTAAGGKCVRFSHELTSGQDEEITFEYKYKDGCTQTNRILVQGDVEACAIQPSPPSVASITAQTTSTGSLVTTTPPQQVDGVCPSTPLTVTTLPSGRQALVDDVSFSGSWIVFQRRVSGAVDFYRDWSEYVDGFGEVSDSYWLGLEEIHRMCNDVNKCELLVYFRYPEKPHSVPQTSDGCYYARYSQFGLGGAETNYELKVSGFKGTSGDSLASTAFGNDYNHNQQQFSTYDRDYDRAGSSNCAEEYHGGWWYNYCHRSNLNGAYGSGGWKYMVWYTLTGQDKSVTYSEMLLRRVA